MEQSDAVRPAHHGILTEKGEMILVAVVVAVALCAAIGICTYCQLTKRVQRPKKGRRQRVRTWEEEEEDADEPALGTLHTEMVSFKL